MIEVDLNELALLRPHQPFLDWDDGFWIVRECEGGGWAESKESQKVIFFQAFRDRDWSC